MPDTPTARRPEDEHGDDFDVSELLSPSAGSSSPFGDVEFPLPVQATGYVHESVFYPPSVLQLPRETPEAEVEAESVSQAEVPP